MGKRHKTVLAYHSIGNAASEDAGADLYTVSLERFKEQVGHLFSQYPDVIISFDDGYEDNYYNVFPILQKMGLKAYFFIIAPKIGTPGFMSWAQVRELRDAGMTIGSHGMTHRILTLLKNGDLDYEFKESKKIIEDNLGHRINFFSIPRGFCNRKVVSKVLECGYRVVFTSNPKDKNNFKYGRIAVKADWDLEYFDKAINNKLPLLKRGEKAIVDTSKKILGARAYDRVRTLVLNGR